MKKLLLGCTVLLGLLVLGLVAFAASLPSTFEVIRVQPVAATPSEAYAVAADLHGWPDWTFWSREGDPGATWDFSGEPGTVGHTMKWNGETWGEGQIVFTGCTPGERIDYELTFWEQGEAMTSSGSITFEAQGQTTQVGWSMSGELDGFVAKLMGLAMETMIGPMFETSLDGLADRLEDSSSQPY
jgi:hypothetical protein